MITINGNYYQNANIVEIVENYILSKGKISILEVCEIFEIPINLCVAIIKKVQKKSELKVSM